MKKLCKRREWLIEKVKEIEGDGGGEVEMEIKKNEKLEKEWSKKIEFEMCNRKKY